MKTVKSVIYVFTMFLLGFQAINVQADILYDCPFGSGGDFTYRGFYIDNYPGSTLETVVLKIQPTSVGNRSFTLTAWENAYDGQLVGSAAVSLDMDGSFTNVTFDFSSAAVTPGATVAFRIEVSGGTAYYDIGTSACADVTQTNGTAAPLDSYRRDRVGVQISGTPSAVQPTPGGITVSPISGNTTEAGGTATFTVVLDSQPTASVSIGLVSDNVAEGLVSPATLVFDDTNWDTPQVATVTGQDDTVVDGDIVFNIITSPAVSGDSAYDGLDADDVSVTNEDNDVAAVAPLAAPVPIPTLSGIALLLMASLMLLMVFRHKRVR